ncbi:hypothetical protein ABZ896_28480 [Streptomyces sp. NPDC047072]|uniref:hypothetical protein n=1 Tax=Streptomyces sp. NPDC047072 TaxID=3154809 RepID=UPI0033F01BDE
MGVRHDDGELSRLWEEHLHAPFPAGFRGVDVAGVDLVLLDSDTAGLVQCELGGGLGDDAVATLWFCVTRLDEVLPLIDDPCCAGYYERLRRAAGVVAARYLPAAT